MRRSLVFHQQYYADDDMWMETQTQHQGYAFHEEAGISDNNYHKRFPAMQMNRLAAFAVDSDLSMSKQHGKLGGVHMNRPGEFAMDSELSMSKQHGKLGGMHVNRFGDFTMDSEFSMSKQQHGKLGGGMQMNRPGAFTTDSRLSMSKQQHGKLGGGMHSDHRFGHGYAHGGGRKFPFDDGNTSHRFSNGGGHHEYFSEETEYEEAYTQDHVGAFTAKMEEMRYQHHNWGGDTCYVNPYDRNKNWWTAKRV